MFLCQRLPPRGSCRAYARLKEYAVLQLSAYNEARENVKASCTPSTASGPPSSRRKAIIRAMPETEIPPAMRVDFYFIEFIFGV